MKFRLVEELSEEQLNRKAKLLVNQVMTNLRRDFPEYEYGVEVQLSDAWEYLAEMQFAPHDKSGKKFILRINRGHLQDTKENVLGSLYHEFAHLFDMIDCINNGVYKWDEEEKSWYYVHGEFAPHGSTFQKWCDKFEDKYDIDLDNHDSDGMMKFFGSHAKYSVICRKCGEITFTKSKTKLVQNCLNVDAGKAEPEYACANCGGMDFEVIEHDVNEQLLEVYPHKGESKKDFIARFMHETKDEYPDVKQRYAVCMSYWERRDKHKITK